MYRTIMMSGSLCVTVRVLDATLVDSLATVCCPRKESAENGTATEMEKNRVPDV